MKWFVGEPALSLRSMAVTSPFIVLFGLIAILARATAMETPSAWFSPGISTQFYEVSLLAASVLTLGMGSIAVARLSRFDQAIRDTDLELAAIRRRLPLASDSDGGRSSAESASVDFMNHLESFGIQSKGSEKLGHETLIDLSPMIQEQAAAPIRSLRDELREQRAHLVELRDRVWPTVIGPIGLAILFVAISGAMLPGAEGFLQANFRLNTTLILLMAYSWWLLVTWAVFALATLPSEIQEQSTPRRRRGETFG